MREAARLLIVCAAGFGAAACYRVIPSSHPPYTVTGIVEAVDDEAMALRHKSGQRIRIALVPGTAVSRHDSPAAVSDIPAEKVAIDPFLRGLRQIVERLFPDEQFSDQRAYVNCSVYGDSYYAHRDCDAQEQHVTALYYANLEWKPDWGGETIYYNDDEDAELIIVPRPGRIVVARGAVLHRGCVPTRSCYEERYTLAYKLNSVSAAVRSRT